MYKYRHRNRYISNKKSYIKLWLKFGDPNSVNFYVARVAIQNGSCRTSHWILYFHFGV